VPERVGTPAHEVRLTHIRTVWMAPIPRREATKGIRCKESEGTMLLRVAIMTLVPLTLAVPAIAQQAMSDQDAHQIAHNALGSWNKAIQARDAAGLASQYTENYVMIGPPSEGSISGRANMEKHWAGLFKAYSPNPDTLVQVIPVSNDVIWAVFGWSGTYNGPKGPVYPKGLTSRVYVRDGNTWEVRAELWNCSGQC
jgi:ketosteroid isomerase-like protein